VDEQTRRIFYRICNFNDTAIIFKTAFVPDLTAGFRIKYGFTGNYFNRIPGLGKLNFFIIFNHDKELGFKFQAVIPFKDSFYTGRGQRLVGLAHPCKFFLGFGSGLLLGHGRIKPLDIQFDVHFLDMVLDDVHRKAKGIVKLKDNLTGYGLLILTLDTFNGGFQKFQAGL